MNHKCITFATLYSTTFLLVRSDLFPTNNLLTPSDAYRSISCSHCLTFVKVSKGSGWQPSLNRDGGVLPLSVTS